MARKKAHTPEEIVAKLRQAEVLMGQGKTVADAVRAIGVTEPTYYRWRTEFGGLKLDQVKRLKELERENARLRKAVSDLTLEKVILKEAASGKLVSPARRRACVEHVVRELGVSERRACAVLGHHRSTQRKAARAPDDEAALTADIVELAKRYGRYGYRRITALLRDAGWAVNRKRVERIWRREGLKVPPRQPKRGRLWLGDGSCVRLRPEHANHVWAYDFVEDRTREGRKFRMLCVVDEFTREALAIRVARKLSSADVIDVLADLFIARGAPTHIRSDQGPEFVADAVKGWIEGVGARTAYIEKASPWENGYVESFNGKLRDELLNGEVFNTLREAQVLIEGWRRHYNRVRPHSALGYRPPAPETVPLPGSQIGSRAGAAVMAH
ncbi:IS3 family transposase [Falsiroseomonas bella]|uniref:IS3 family transposase n=1 Tax=Falsiroseomonas bella TaxID=2184016 RepID=A0A317F582_9PROT|nr:IS3 family transposase [Falsiroseomonas bella]PWS34300.1 IS3 family transposase [Falsiroseomonas bella]